jgi:hypothetical protein
MSDLLSFLMKKSDVTEKKGRANKQFESNHIYPDTNL